MRGVVRTGAGDDRHVDDFLDGLDEFDLLIHVRRRRLTGGAVDHEAVGTVGHQLFGNRLGHVEIDIAVGLHRCDHRGQYAAERGRIEKMHNTVTHNCNGTC